MTTRIDEAGFISGLKDRVTQGVKNVASNVADRAKYAAGEHEALGRLDLRAATKELMTKWRVYAGRKAAAGDKNIADKPTVRNLVDFLGMQYGLRMDPDEINRALHGEDVDLSDNKTDKTPSAAPEPAPAEPEAPEALKQAAEKAGRGGKPADTPEEAERKAALKAQMAKQAADDNMGESLTEAQNTTFVPQRDFPRIADMLIDNGIMTVSRKGEVTSGWRNGGDSSDEQGINPVSPEEAAKLGSKITDDGKHLDVKKLAAALKAKNIGEDDFNWMRKQITQPKALIQAMQGAAGAEGAKYAGIVANFTTAILSAITDKDVADKSINVTDKGMTVDIDKMNAALKEKGVNGKQITALKDTLSQKGGEDELIKLLVAGKDTAVDPTFGIISAFMNSIAKVQQKKGK